MALRLFDEFAHLIVWSHRNAAREVFSDEREDEGMRMRALQANNPLSDHAVVSMAAIFIKQMPVSHS